MLTGKTGCVTQEHFVVPLKFFCKSKTLKLKSLGLPWWLSGVESTCQCRRHQYDPWAERIPHAKEQLNP